MKLDSAPKKKEEEAEKLKQRQRKTTIAESKQKELILSKYLVEMTRPIEKNVTPKLAYWIRFVASYHDFGFDVSSSFMFFCFPCFDCYSC